ncbi:dynein axonemal light chain 1 isoform X2 [Vanacampus margaritifer]
MVGGKATTIKEALTRWAYLHFVFLCVQEEKTGEKCGEATVVKLYGQIPPIEKLDNTLNKIPNCEKLSMSTNCIDKITNLGELKNLKILSLGRNNIKAFTGLDAVGDTLEELWISYNLIEKMKGVHLLKKLRVLYMTNNLVKDWGEFSKLADLPCLVDLVFVGNPLEEKHTPDGTWMDEATKRLPRLTKLDGIPVIKQDAGEDDD